MNSNMKKKRKKKKVKSPLYGHGLWHLEDRETFKPLPFHKRTKMQDFLINNCVTSRKPLTRTFGH